MSGHQYQGQLEEVEYFDNNDFDDDYDDDEDGSYCDACDEFGMYVICVDDLCHSGSGCIHGGGEIICPYCKGKGKL